MKKLVTIVSVIFLMIFGTSISFAEEINVYIDNQLILFQDEKPLLEDGRVLLPVRAVQESMGAELKWNPETEQIYSTKEQGNAKTSILYRINSPYTYKQFYENNYNKQYIEMIDTSAKVKRGRTFIPLRSATESFGYDVIWKENENAVYLKSNPTIKPKDSTQQYVMEGDFFKLKEIEKEIFFLTNKERVKQGLKPFILDVNVSKVAQIKSADMYNKSYFDHTSPTYGSPFEMMKQFNIEYIAAGENIAAGYSSAVEVTNGWMKSQGHRENILNEDFTRIGIGYYEADNNYRTYYTQLFSKQQRDVK